MLMPEKLEGNTNSVDIISRLKILKKSWVIIFFFLLSLGSFAAFSYHQKQIVQAYELRHSGLLMASELRNSVYELSQKAKAYVASGDLSFKALFQEILAVRNGDKARSDEYYQIEWRKSTMNAQPLSIENRQSIAFLERVSQFGFTSETYGKIEEAKIISDRLAELELQSMRLFEATRKEEALQMLDDSHYHLSKAAVLGYLNEFYGLLEKQTQQAIITAEQYSVLARYALIVFFFLTILSLYRFQTALFTLLGGSAEEIETVN